ncbi:Myoblast determination protein 1 [Frankliniella fusca]|uniref:Myoblast determination protein 1 n=1 Tax=Frankliniella fusca TaxID=407009 RepID=A0AAE1L7W6_9NEOP|nr:Myoblast determination protein 1 [Frankliniella fusca]
MIFIQEEGEEDKHEGENKNDTSEFRRTYEINEGASTSSADPENSMCNDVTNTNTDTDKNDKNGNSTSGSAKERFNKTNSTVTPLKKCSELTANVRYRIINIVRTNTKFGVGIRAEIADSNSPTGSSFVFLPSRHRNMSDADIEELNRQAIPKKGYIWFIREG